MKWNVTLINGGSTVSGLHSSIGMQCLSDFLSPRLGPVQPQHKFATQFLQPDNIITKDLGEKIHCDTHIDMALISNSQRRGWSRVKVDQLLFWAEEMSNIIVFLGSGTSQMSIHTKNELCLQMAGRGPPSGIYTLKSSPMQGKECVTPVHSLLFIIQPFSPCWTTWKSFIRVSDSNWSILQYS